MYLIVIDRHAQKQLGKITSPYFNRIVKAINELASNPRPPGCKKLTARPGYRIRIADFRVIYTIEDKILTIFIIEIGNRREVYD